MVPRGQTGMARTQGVASIELVCGADKFVAHRDSVGSPRRGIDEFAGRARTDRASHGRARGRGPAHRMAGPHRVRTAPNSDAPADRAGGGRA